MAPANAHVLVAEAETLVVAAGEDGDVLADTEDDADVDGDVLPDGDVLADGEVDADEEEEDDAEGEADEDADLLGCGDDLVGLAVADVPAVGVRDGLSSLDEDGLR